MEHLCFLGPEELVHAFAKEASQGSSQSLPTDEFESEAQEARQRAARRTKSLKAYVIIMLFYQISLKTSMHHEVSESWPRCRFTSTV